MRQYNSSIMEKNISPNEALHAKHQGNNLSDSGCILIVEDDELVRSMAKAMLELLGYRVITANDGQEGVELFREKYGTIDAVLLDLKMPRLNGAETFKVMIKIDPQVRVLISTAYSSLPEIEDLLALGAKEICIKPYTIEQLSKMITKVMGH